MQAPQPVDYADTVTACCRGSEKLTVLALSEA
jgi:hypothetical protein